eukprot:15909722-Heterocapsa_arctica.AAC.1
MANTLDLPVVVRARLAPKTRVTGPQTCDALREKRVRIWVGSIVALGVHSRLNALDIPDLTA